MTLSIHPVILSGGGGTRLWPRSRKAKPKPFLPLLGDRTLFQQALDRCSGSANFAAPLIVAGAAHFEHIQAQAGPDAVLIIEPAARNTAPAIALAAAWLPEDAIMLVCPSDHHIIDRDAFITAAGSAAALASDDRFVAFGITPDRPETGYGYIRRGDPVGGGYAIDSFVEKPEFARAQAYLAVGGYDWNGGIFAFRAGAFMTELARHRPDMARLVRDSLAGGRSEGQFVYPAAEPFAAIEAESVDYALMENTDRAAVVPVAMGWSDVGNWQALRDARPGDEAGNRVSGDAELVDCRNVLVDTDGPHVSVVGLDDVIVVVDGDRVLVAAASAAGSVGKLEGASNQ